MNIKLIMTIKLDQFKWVFFLSLPLVLISSYYLFLYEPQMLDQKAIYDPLLKINTYSEYFTQLADGKITDLQPLRDLSLLTDIYIGRALGFTNFPLITNIFIHFLTGFFIFLCLQKFTNKSRSGIISFVYLTHPAIFQAFHEFTARKHSLSFLLFLISYYFFQVNYFEDKKSYIKSLFFYSLSLFAQPINAATPLFFFCHKNIPPKITKRNILLGTPFIVMIALTGWANVYYYQLTNQGFEIPIPFKHEIDHLILGINLYFRQLFLPISFSYYYKFENLFNIITVFINGLIGCIAYLSYKKISSQNKRTIKLGLILLLSIFATLYIPKTNILNSVFQNYYLYTPAFAIIIIIIGYQDYLAKIPLKKYLIVIYSILAVSLNIYHVKPRKDFMSLMKHFSKTEDTCIIFQMLSTNTLERGNKKEFIQYSKEWLDRRCIVVADQYNYARVLINSFLIIYSDDFKYNEKRDLFIQKFPRPYDYISVMAILSFEEGLRGVALEYLEKLKNFEEPSLFLTMTNYIKEFKKVCNEQVPSEEQQCKTFEEYLKRIEGKRTSIFYRKKIDLTLPDNE